MPMQDLSDTTAVHTGVGRGIGRATAVALASAGAHVVGVARSEPELLEFSIELGRDRFTRSSRTPSTRARPAP